MLYVSVLCNFSLDLIFFLYTVVNDFYSITEVTPYCNNSCWFFFLDRRCRTILLALAYRLNGRHYVYMRVRIMIVFVRVMVLLRLV